MSVARTTVLAAAALILLEAPAWAHPGLGVPGGFASGFLHPLSGLDHVVAMVSVGLWAAMLGGGAVGALPVAFPLVMAVGGGLGMAGVPMPSPEIGIALSAVVLGLLVALSVRAPLGVAVVTVGLFALFHGYAHGRELPETADMLSYAVGFVAATALLHGVGIGAGLAMRTGFGRAAVRATGLAVAVLGGVFLQAALT